MMPAELRPNWKRKLNTKDGSRKIAKDVNVEETLKALEQKEKTRKADGAPNEDEDKESEVCLFNRVFQREMISIFIFIHQKCIILNSQEVIEDEEQDEEMDDENDYGNNYFDDGGNYLDEDDNLDDGPTY